MSSTGEFRGTGGKGGEKELEIFIFICRCSFCNIIFSSSHHLHLHKEDAKHWSEDGSEEETSSEEEEDGEDSFWDGDRML